MLIGLHGKARSGKDTVYNMIAEDFSESGVKVIRDAFADRLKISAMSALGFVDDHSDEERIRAADRLKVDGTLQYFDSQGHPGLEISGREYLQYYGTEAHREVFGQDFWVDAVLPNWQDDDYGREDDLGREDILVITDVRFPNEAERILDCGGAVWHLIRPDAEVGDTHASEQVLAPNLISATIENLTSLDALRAKVHLAVYNELSRQVAA